MAITEFQPLNPGVFQDGLFVANQEATLEQIEKGDARQACVILASAVRQV